MPGTVGEESIADQVREYIDARPVVRDALAMGIVNMSGLARKVMESTGIDQEDAVHAACRRYRAHATEFRSTVRKALRESKLDVRTHVGLLSYAPSWRLVEALAKKMHALRGQAERVHLLHGWEAFTIVADEQLLQDLEAAMGREEPIDRRVGLAELNINSPETMDGTPGFIATLSSALAERDVNLVDASSCRRDHLFLIDDDDLSLAIEVFHGLMQD